MRRISFISFAILFLLFNLKAFGQNDGLDQLQKQYLMKLDRIRREIHRSQLDELSLYWKLIGDLQKDNVKDVNKIYQEIDHCQLLRNALEKEAEDLETDALKYYKGNLPKDLDKEWRIRENKMLDSKWEYLKEINVINEKIGKFLRKKGLKE